MESNLPPGVVMEDGELVRYIDASAESGAGFKRRRPVVLDSLDHARELEADYFHPVHGWIIYGRKIQKEHFLEGGERPIQTPTTATPAPVTQPQGWK